MIARLVGCILLGLVTLVACDAPSQRLPPTDVSSSLSGGPATATGDGQYLIILGTLNRQGTFSFSAIQTSPDDSATGRLQVILDFLLGASASNDPDRSPQRRCPIPI